MRDRRDMGFTLVELMIVASIIIIVITLAVVGLIRSRMSAYEAAAIGGIRNIAAGEVAYQASNFTDADGDGHGDFGTLEQLADPVGNGQSPAFIDNTLISGNRLGYVYTIVVTLGGGAVEPFYTCIATPAEPGRTGYRRYYVDANGVVRFTADGSVPDAHSTILD